MSSPLLDPGYARSLRSGPIGWRAMGSFDEPASLPVGFGTPGESSGSVGGAA